MNALWPISIRTTQLELGQSYGNTRCREVGLKIWPNIAIVWTQQNIVQIRNGYISLGMYCNCNLSPLYPYEKNSKRNTSKILAILFTELLFDCICFQMHSLSFPQSPPRPMSTPLPPAWSSGNDPFCVKMHQATAILQVAPSSLTPSLHQVIIMTFPWMIRWIYRQYRCRTWRHCHPPHGPPICGGSTRQGVRQSVRVYNSTGGRGLLQQ